MKITSGLFVGSTASISLLLDGTTFLLLETPFLCNNSRLLSAILSWLASLLGGWRLVSFTSVSVPVSLFLLRFWNLLSANLLSVLTVSSLPDLSEACWARLVDTTATNNTTKICNDIKLVLHHLRWMWNAHSFTNIANILCFHFYLLKYFNFIFCLLSYFGWLKWLMVLELWINSR